MPKMKHICTASDKNYLLKGLTLFESLCDTTENFVLHYLALDDEAFDILCLPENQERFSGRLLVYSYREFPNLLSLKDSDYYLYCCASASVLCSHFASGSNDIVYVDSDILFHKNIDVIYDAIGDNSVGIFRHRQFTSPRPEGFFNVGVVYFKSDDIGRYVSSWWEDAVLNKRLPEFATCGDQKYLDVFPYMCKGKLFIDGNIGHGAPWLWQLYSPVRDGVISWEGEEQELIFSHFSALQVEPFIPSTSHHCYTPPAMYQTPWLKKIYMDYYRALMGTKERYTLSLDRKELS